MRIVGGSLRGRALDAPPGNATRPTTDRVREAIFNILSARLSLAGTDTLDLFAGSGALGLEAISRGAAACTFVESHNPTLRTTRENARRLGVEEACTFVRGDVLAFAAHHSGPPFDLILADPPYDLPALATLPERILPLLRADGLFILEHDAKNGFADHPAFEQQRAYGRTIVSMFRGPADL